jgi:hypothetical protein
VAAAADFQVVAVTVDLAADLLELFPAALETHHLLHYPKETMAAQDPQQRLQPLDKLEAVEQVQQGLMEPALEAEVAATVPYHQFLVLLLLMLVEAAEGREVRLEELAELAVAVMAVAAHLRPQQSVQQVERIQAAVAEVLETKQQQAAQAALALSSYATQHLISLSLCSTLLPDGLLLSA